MQSRWETMLNKAESESANVKAEAKSSSSSSNERSVSTDLSSEPYPSEDVSAAPTATYETGPRR